MTAEPRAAGASSATPQRADDYADDASGDWDMHALDADHEEVPHDE